MNREKAIRFGTLIGFGVVFEAIIMAASHLGHPPVIDPLVLVAMVLAASLVARALAYLVVFEWLRAPFTTVVPHPSGAGEDVHPITSDGSVIGIIREVVGTWVCCPICAGTWGALGLFVFYTIDPIGGKFLVFVLAAASAGSILTRAVEMIEWVAHSQHEQTGYLNRINKEAAVQENLIIIHTDGDGIGEGPSISGTYYYGGDKKNVN